MARLGVNIDHVATVRQARGTSEPDPVTAAALAELAGADGITVHLREDRRHIQDRDVELLRRTVQHPAQPGDGGHRRDGRHRPEGPPRCGHPGAGAARGADHRRGAGRASATAQSAQQHSGYCCARGGSWSACSSIPTWSRSRPRTGSAPRPSRSIPALLRSRVRRRSAAGNWRRSTPASAPGASWG